MDHSVQIGTTRFRFSVRALLLFILAAALVLWTGREAYDQYRSFALADLISDFNKHAKEHTDVGVYEPPLTTDEVVAAINKQLPLDDATPAINATFARIARTGRAPENSRFSGIEFYTDENGQRVVWWIRFQIRAGEFGGYSLAIRDTNDPAILRITPMAPITNYDIIQFRERSKNGRPEQN